MPDFGLFEASHIACPVVPQYHPKQLMELLNSGKIRWVKAILAHLVRCLGGTEQIRQRSGGSFNNEDGSRSPRAWSRSRTLSVSYGQGQMTNSASGGLSPGIDTFALFPQHLQPALTCLVGMADGQNRASMPEELTLDYTEINSIPPLPLWTLLAADHESGKPVDSGAVRFSSLF